MKNLSILTPLGPDHLAVAVLWGGCWLLWLFVALALAVGCLICAVGLAVVLLALLALACWLFGSESLFSGSNLHSKEAHYDDFILPLRNTARTVLQFRV